MVDYMTAGASIRRREDRDGRFQLVINYEDDTGRHQRSRMLPKTVKSEPAARRELSKWRVELDAAEREASERAERAASSDVTVLAWCDGYVNGTIAGSRSVRRSTLAGYNASMRYIERGLVHRRLSDLTTEEIQAWVNGLNERYAPITVRKALQLLHRCLDAAVSSGALKGNPCEGVMQPRMAQREKNSLSIESARRVMASLMGMESTPLVVGAAIALSTGMRIGEICALRWSDVDLCRSELRVSHSIERGDGGTALGETKRTSSNRVIPIGVSLEAVLRDRRSVIEGKALAAWLDTSDIGSLFVLGDLDGAYVTPNWLSTQWRQLSHAMGWVGLAGRPVTFHDLRHTYATVAIASGADVMAVSSYLGHSDPQLTLRTYANADPDAKRRTADAVESAMRP